VDVCLREGDRDLKVSLLGEVIKGKEVVLEEGELLCWCDVSGETVGGLPTKIVDRRVGDRGPKACSVWEATEGVLKGRKGPC
jgi:hypothetical protein